MLKEYVHRFRNALVKAADTESHKLFRLDRWEDLNSFPSGSCDIASNFLSEYLREKGIHSTIIWCKNDLAQYPIIKSHVWLEVGDLFVDITACQFPYINKRIYIQKKDPSLMLMEIYEDCISKGPQYYEERSIDLGSGQALYCAIKKIAEE